MKARQNAACQIFPPLAWSNLKIFQKKWVHLQRAGCLLHIWVSNLAHRDEAVSRPINVSRFEPLTASSRLLRTLDQPSRAAPSAIRQTRHKNPFLQASSFVAKFCHCIFQRCIALNSPCRFDNFWTLLTTFYNFTILQFLTKPIFFDNVDNFWLLSQFVIICHHLLSLLLGNLGTCWKSLS